MFITPLPIKHTAWSSRLISPGKAKELLSAKELNREHRFSRKPTYWPKGARKIPDLLNFFISKGIGLNYIEVDLTSDHAPVLLFINANVIKKKNKINFTSKNTNWDIFRDKIKETVNLKISLKSKETELQSRTSFIKNIKAAASKATPEPKETRICEINYPVEIRQQINEI